MQVCVCGGGDVVCGGGGLLFCLVVYMVSVSCDGCGMEIVM